MKVILFKDYLKTIQNKDYIPETICEIQSITEFPDGIVELEGKLARCCSFDSIKDIMTIEYIEKPIDEDEVFQSEEITCPYCGHIESDSWECSDEDDIICSTCGSEYYYQRIVEVSYTSIIKKKNNKITKLK